MDYMSDPEPEEVTEGTAVADSETEGDEIEAIEEIEDEDGDEVVEETISTEEAEDETTKSEQNYKDFGMDTDKILLGAMQLVAGAVMLLVLMFLIYCMDNYLMPYCGISVLQLYANIKSKIFWNAPLRALIE